MQCFFLNWLFIRHFYEWRHIFFLSLTYGFNARTALSLLQIRVCFSMLYLCNTTIFCPFPLIFFSLSWNMFGYFVLFKFSKFVWLKLIHWLRTRPTRGSQSFHANILTPFCYMIQTLFFFLKFKPVKVMSFLCWVS